MEENTKTDFTLTLLDVTKTIKAATLELLPTKSKNIYETRYKTFVNKTL